MTNNTEGVIIDRDISFKLILLIIGTIFLSRPIHAQQVNKKISIEENQKYLNFPIRGWSSDVNSNDGLMRILHEGKVVDEFSINLAENDPDWWAFFPLEQYQGEVLTIELDDPTRQEGLEKVHASSQIKNHESLYKEKHRQQIHFSNKRGWNNDPNGMIYYNGQWHLYFQYNPYGWNWGNMHWGHAVSSDLVHWKELPIALYSPDHSHMAFSGGATIDPKNTSGFRKNGIDPLIATYTRTESGEHLALSYDNGRTFEEYEGNPVVEHTGRDPKVFWYEPGNHWVMIVYSESQKRDLSESGDEIQLYQHSIYTSSNLKDWQYQSGITNFFECPELFELPVQGIKDTQKWVMYDADGKYMIGDFDGKKFTVEQGLKKFDYGGEFYASQTFSNVPKEDGRRIQIGWFQISTPQMPFNQSMTFPTELKLKKKQGSYVLTPKPVKEIKKLYEQSYSIKDKVVSGGTTVTAPLNGEQLHIIAEFEKGDAPQFGINVNGYELTYDILRSKLNDTFYPIGKTLRLEIIVDRLSVEVFVDDGELYYADEFNSVDTSNLVEVFARGGDSSKMLLKNLEIHRLSSIWGK